jgi:hypothetical protein
VPAGITTSPFSTFAVALPSMARANFVIASVRPGAFTVIVISIVICLLDFIKMFIGSVLSAFSNPQTFSSFPDCHKSV